MKNPEKPSERPNAKSEHVVQFSEKALADPDESLALLPEQNPAPVLRVSRAGTLLYANPAAIEAFKKWRLGVGEAVPTAIRTIVTDALDAMVVRERELTVEAREYVLSVVPIPGADYVNLYSRDVTEHKRAEEALRESEERYRTELETEVNARTEELVQLTRELSKEIVERKLAEEALQHREAALRCSQDELRTLTAQLMTAQEDERRRISSDIHDDTNQRLAMLTMDLETLLKDLPASSDPIRPALQAFHRNVAELSDQLGRLAYRLHPSILDDLGLPVAVQRYAEDYAQRTGIACNVAVRTAPESLPPGIASGLYRILQECLGNILKHACATKVTIRLSDVGAYVQLSVHDNGVGVDRDAFKNRKEGLGFLNMIERTRMLSGQFSVQSQPGQGTMVTVLVPRHRQDAIEHPRRLLVDDHTLILEDTGQF